MMANAVGALVPLLLTLLSAVVASELPAALLPDVAYFDAGYSAAPASLVRDPSSGAVASLRDLLTDARDPSKGSQRLDWHGQCTYDDTPSTGAGGSVVLDGASCYATLASDTCGWEKTLEGGYTIVLVARLDPSTPSHPSSNTTTIPTLVMLRHIYSGPEIRVMPYGAGYLYWTASNFGRHILSQNEQDYDENADDLELEINPPIPTGAWTVEAVSQDVATNATNYYRGATSKPLMSGSKPGLIGPSGRYASIGCLWSATNKACLPGSFAAGRFAALLVYSRPLAGSEVAAISAHYKARFVAPQHPPWPPSPPPSPPPPPGTGLPLALLPDVAYFDMASATAPRTLSVDAASGRVAQTLDQVYPFDQRLEWHGDCRYDASNATGAKGSIVLDGKSCYGRLKYGPLCTHNWDIFDGDYDERDVGYSLVMVVRLDDDEHTTLATYSRPDGYYYAVGDVLWGPTTVIKRGFTDYGDDDLDMDNVTSAADYSLKVPVGRWTLEVITWGSWSTTDNRTAYYRSPAQRGGKVELVPQHRASPKPDGEYVVIGCDWDADPWDDRPEGCSGYYMKGRLMAFMAYSYALTKDDVQELYEFYSARWPVKEPGLPPPPPALQPPVSKPKDWDLRLVGAVEGEGVLLVYANKTWNVVCSSYFVRANAEAACRQMGFSGGRAYFGLTRTAIGLPAKYVARECDPKKASKHLADCPVVEGENEAEDYCDEIKDISVRCDAPPLPSPPPSPPLQRVPARRVLRRPL